ncbi:protein of unknown function [Bradyrhizobium sp. ORS 285]|nr:hypothetical protein BRAO285_1320053 [Bradyrhizobium sp. ORS 285]SMX60811.1 protein of unknown function [Bradyrhizobium sp. ORS 285]
MRKHCRGMVANEPGTRETAYKRSTHRAGNAGMSRLNLWYLPPAFFSQAGHGCGQRPAFPAPSALREGHDDATLGHACRESAPLCPSIGCARGLSVAV